jgi:predicted RNA-binding protein with PUA-like domain
MAYFLAKTDSAEYSIEQFERDKATVWDGIRNPLALRAIRSMQPGDDVLIYHSAGQAAIVGPPVLPLNLAQTPTMTKAGW